MMYNYRAEWQYGTVAYEPRADQPEQPMFDPMYDQGISNQYTQRGESQPVQTFQQQQPLYNSQTKREPSKANQQPSDIRTSQPLRAMRHISRTESQEALYHHGAEQQPVFDPSRAGFDPTRREENFRPGHVHQSSFYDQQGADQQDVITYEKSFIGNNWHNPNNHPTSSASSSLAELKEEWKPTRALYAVILTLCIIALGTALDATSISVALPTMAKALNGTAIEAFWSGTSFLLTQTVFQPSYAAFSHIFGRKPLLLIGLVLFGVGSVVAAVAKNFGTVIIGRVFQGLGAGGIISITAIIFTDLIPLRERAKYLSYLQMMWAIGSVSGPLVGGAFAENVSWTWIFWINLPFAGIGFILVPIFLKLTHRSEHLIKKLKMVDWGGTVLFVSSATSMLIPLTWGGVMYEWSHWRTVVPLVVGIVGLIGFVFYERYVPQQPMIKLYIFTQRTTVSSYVGTVMHGIIMWCTLYYLPLYYEGVLGMTPIMSGVAVLPLTLTVAPISVIIGLAISATGRFRWAIWMGWVLTIVGSGLLTFLGPETTTAQWIFLVLVVGVGTGTLFPGTMMAVQSSNRDKDVAYAVAMYTFCRSFGQCFGVAIGGVIFQNALSSKLSEFPELKDLASHYAQDAVALVTLINNMPENDPTRASLISAYAKALSVVWMAMIGFASIGFVASWFIEGLSLDRKLESEQQLRVMKEKAGSVYPASEYGRSESLYHQSPVGLEYNPSYEAPLVTVMNGGRTALPES